MRSIDVGDIKDLVNRIYLLVSPEEYPDVQASGACWDDTSKSWYIGEDLEAARFSRWLREEEGETPFGIVSKEAFVASALGPCARCGSEIELVCIYCKSGVDAETGDPIADFTVFNIWAMDVSLAKLIARWPCYRQGVGEDAEARLFANHCPHCGAIQKDYRRTWSRGMSFSGSRLTHRERLSSWRWTGGFV